MSQILTCVWPRLTPRKSSSVRSLRHRACTVRTGIHRLHRLHENFGLGVSIFFLDIYWYSIIYGMYINVLSCTLQVSIYLIITLTVHGVCLTFLTIWCKVQNQNLKLTSGSVSHSVSQSLILKLWNCYDQKSCQQVIEEVSLWFRVSSVASRPTYFIQNKI